ncbi:glyoxalase/bleomycin resistance protein/dioxygenase superfamily protein [Tenacibaculum gallaicum]|uniref:Glyoxalase/bleomycin resistance protein/dioxygenase superfamily protein n=1 Tax=Tenacibaculum gallaicum TaxID=561505 RepID=A0A3E0HHG3_9FLAO|nr:VOC family protein [Tenacibaculum gallaicum]REH45863.1 glyoxalase/bleomycin resistance protein/dioxygenase superfamily protein [Tenacibaculum gallaicum]
MNKKNDFEIINTRYVLAVKDLVKSADYYENQLGFSTLWKGDGWHFLKRGKFMVMLGECKNDKSAFEIKNHSYFAYIDVENIDNLYTEYLSKEVELISEVTDKSWGQREFGIRTIDGHRIMFGQEIQTK